MSTKYTYIEVRERPWNRGDVRYRKDATHMSKAEREQLFSQLEKQYPPDCHAHATVTTAQSCGEVK